MYSLSSPPLLTDDQGRIEGTSACGMDYSFCAFDLTSDRSDQVQIIDTYKKLSQQISDGTVTSPTHWISCVSQPHNELEDLALQIFNFHTRAVESFDVFGGGERCGAEWWISHTKTEAANAVKNKTDTDKESDDNSLGFHYDKDEILSEAGMGVFPALR